jgi:predicted DsbA family dithiol-disulfide isomerase
MGVQGVPFFVFEDKWGVSGAIGEEGFQEVSDTHII